MSRVLLSRITGYVLSLTLTFLAYFIIVQPELFGFTNQFAVTVIFGLALAQSVVQLLFFIDVWHEKSSYWNLTLFISTAAIVFIVIFFSILIIDHLNYNMHC